MIGFEKRKVLLLSGMVLSVVGVTACSSSGEDSKYQMVDEVILQSETTKVVAIENKAPVPEQALDAPLGGGQFVERTPYNALPAKFGNAAEDMAVSIPADEVSFVTTALDEDCDDDYRILMNPSLNDIPTDTVVLDVVTEQTTIQSKAETDGKNKVASAGTISLAKDGQSQQQASSSLKDGAEAIVMRGAVAGEVEETQPVEDWLAPEGASLRALLMDWGDRGGWKVIWKSDREYVLEAGAVFRGRYMDVTSALVRTFARARPAPIATFYKGNRVLLITTLEDENAD